MKHIFSLLFAAGLVIVAGSCSRTTPPQAANRKTPSRQGYAAVNGIRMYYEVHGSGKPLVLVHGGGSMIPVTFGAILPLLAQQHQVIAVELQGHGRTSDRPAPESFTQDAADVIGLLDQLKIKKASLFGFSNGANTAMQAAINHPERIHKLVLASVFFRREGLIPGLFGMLRGASLAQMPEPLKKAFLAVNPDSAALENMHNKDRDRMLAVKDWPAEEIAGISAPTLLLLSDRDVVTPEHAVEMFRLLPKAQLNIQPGLHGACIGDVSSGSAKPERVRATASLVNDFLTAK
ncbi:alpha/beta hydrolase [Pedobacter yulinensis]|uniref:Alpha/beta hydrolase n=1 Tax=Pedobacter yulinensis TaxID=2126353 RepID=A0A2T3HJM9_9SPHI|nr:alpha/beta hydrolase [Pedobacter yulinensis]PST82591.1 alpha/beta hydrolase [Pedobacter yulinensis]